MVAEQIDYRTRYFNKYLEPEHHMKALMEASVVTLDIPPRILYPLEDAGIRTVGDLINQHRMGLREIGRIGREAAAYIYKILADAALID